MIWILSIWASGALLALCSGQSAAEEGRLCICSKPEPNTAAVGFYASPIWSKLLENCKTAETLRSFKSKLKTHLFLNNWDTDQYIRYTFFFMRTFDKMYFIACFVSGYCLLGVKHFELACCGNALHRLTWPNKTDKRH